MAIVGRPNVGKSTLLNTLVGEKLSIVTDKPHTTRQRVLGVLNRGPDQAVFIDTPGHARRTKRALHRLMARQIHQALEDCDVALLVVEAERLTSQDYQLIEILDGKLDRTFLVVNKIDALASKIELLPTLEKLANAAVRRVAAGLRAHRRESRAPRRADLRAPARRSEAVSRRHGHGPRSRVSRWPRRFARSS